MRETNPHARKKLCLIIIASSMTTFIVTYHLSNMLAYSDDNPCAFNMVKDCFSNANTNVSEAPVLRNNVTVRGHCSLRASQLGNHQKVLSYCLFGNFSRYASGLSSILASAKSLYPGWSVRLYTIPELYIEEMDKLLQEHTNLFICDVANLPGTRQDIRHVEPRMWRLAALADEQVDVVLFRDTDAVIIPREVAAVEEFLASGRTLHVMRDHPGHDFPILAGMFGVNQTEANRRNLAHIREKLFNKGTVRLNKDNMRSFDQQILKKYLYEVLSSAIFVHDSYYCTRFFPRGHPFPTQREDRMFIGNRRYRDGLGDEKVPSHCPVSCRPKNHSEWLYC